MSKLPPLLTFIFIVLITGSSMAADTVAKVNFCHRDGNYDEPGWASVYGTECSYPIELGNGMTLVKVDGLYPHLGDIFLADIGIELDNFPANVINSSNYLANTASVYTLGFKITGLDPNEEYKFDVYSRGRDVDEERISKFSVTGDDTITLNSSYNEEIIYFNDLQPNSAGELTLSVTKLPGGYAYISGWIITKAGGTKVKETAVSNISLYPNPTGDFVQVNNLPSNSMISVFNIAGKRMVENTISNDNYLVDMRSFKSGIYLFRISNTSTTQTFKLIKR